MSKKTDPRVIRTRNLLREALLGLIPEKGYSAVTVNDITERATLNRSTFYMHYADKDDLFQHIITEVLDELHEIKPLAAVRADMITIRRIYIHLFKHVQAHHDFYVLMLGNQSVAHFTRQMQARIQRLIIELMHPYPADANRIDAELYASFVSSAFLGVTQWWIASGGHHSPEDIALQFMQLTLGGMTHEFSIDPDALFRPG